MEECIKIISSIMCPKNVCRAYEFAKLFEEPILVKKCMYIICTRTTAVLNASTFNNVELSTLITIFDQDELNILSELELFVALKKYFKNQTCSGAEDTKIDDTASPSTETSYRDPAIRDLVKKIRFLTLTPQQFADGPGSSSLLTLREKFAIFMNISSTKFPMPEGFCTKTVSRKNIPFLFSSPVFGSRSQ